MSDYKIFPTELMANYQDIAELDFSQYKWKLTESRDAIWDVETYSFIECEYRRFLILIKLYPDHVIVPSRKVDELWHTHIIDTKRYREDCQRIFGQFIDHYPSYANGDSELLALFEKNKAVL